MKRKYGFILFPLVLGVHLLSLAAQWSMVEMISKCLLMPVLAICFVTWAGRVNKPGVFILFALLFSWGGDVLLMFQGRNSLFFLSGLASFLIAHIFYIIFFHQIKKREQIRSRFWTALVVAVYYSVLITLLNPWLGEMRLPVRIYGLVISFMFLLALHMIYLGDKIAGRLMVAGALLFVMSDSVLAINKFYQPVPAADLVIMLTYGLAQYLLVRGAAKVLSVEVDLSSRRS
ncbi:lysoplasmalogenase [Terrimonas sp. NA20]|uniref:Lysoplasmalogenase n=1 Tax=Terrimonas ginsenosidimutans TaxID=2908004 RepID=A0ABS9KNQ5_9BACT|nr:lysoplasmalogenase [Terrimonas ginsenosidimutans]MCG2613914.1 lysoplasmalogenase [Terrimonas ginsenosidimutans]